MAEVGKLKSERMELLEVWDMDDDGPGDVYTKWHVSIEEFISVYGYEFPFYDEIDETDVIYDYARFIPSTKHKNVLIWFNQNPGRGVFKITRTTFD